MKNVSINILISISGSFLLAATASAGVFIPCSTISGGINTLNTEAGTNCTVQDKLYQFIGSSSDQVYIGNVLNSPVGMEFFGATQTVSQDVTAGNPAFPITGGPIDFEYIVSVINPFNSSPNPLVISSSTISSLLNATGSGSLGGTVSFCVGQTWDASGNSGFNGNFTGDDGCADNGGTLSSMAISSGNAFSFNPTTTSVAVWDHVTIDSGAGFGTLGETFSQSMPAPEPVSLALFGAGFLAMGLIRRSNKTR